MLHCFVCTELSLEQIQPQVDSLWVLPHRVQTTSSCCYAKLELQLGGAAQDDYWGGGGVALNLSSPVDPPLQWHALC